PSSGTVLEVASGTGEHAAFFAARLPALTWLPTDPDPAQRASIAAWRQASSAQNLRPPLEIDVTREPWPAEADAPAAVVAINMIHIAPWPATLALLVSAARR